jgi:hypothetical protein
VSGHLEQTLGQFLGQNQMPRERLKPFSGTDSQPRPRNPDEGLNR